MKKALLVIDLQRDFCPGGSLAVDRGDSIVPAVNAAAAAFPKVVATGDWHPPGHVSFASSHPGKKELETVSLGGEDQRLWPDHCLAGSRGAEFHPDFNLTPVNLILHKGTSIDLDSYSAFFENDHKTATGLQGYLNDLGIEELYISGLATDYCVFYTVMDALALGFKVKIIREAVAGVDYPPGSADRALGEMEIKGAVITKLEEIIR